MLTDILRPAPVSSIDDVLAIMAAIDDRLPDSDGLKWFNRLYQQVTRSVRQAVAGPTFRDARFMSELDVVFANLYFAAIAEGDDHPSRAPSAWRPLLLRGQPGYRPIAVRARGNERAHQSRSAAGDRGVFTRLEAIPPPTALASGLRQRELAP